ncbi:ankyrin [Lentithecium fluviatile CBS 122367]|uniref:Ankyrin n=1 Tax=Lentithecium fluviatile CBS 122367 TaxID=1168545 RepID=A0A6G1IW45_9PLEO|nr:ankyrin [Lentithecium fluviatile CBS 122367]
MSAIKDFSKTPPSQDLYDNTDAGPSVSYHHTHDIDPTLPSYTEHATTLRDRVQHLVAETRNDEEGLPITKYPDSSPGSDSLYGILPERHDGHAPYRRCQLIVKMYFDAITSKKDEVVALLIESGLVTTETTNEAGRTPLLAAVEAGNVRTVQQLMDYDAKVNAFGVTAGLPKPYYGKPPMRTYRTPLQYAAEKGNMTIIKLLMETYQADDSIIAPDGQHALRLAATHGHREIVQYLPSRRGGGWQRWKTKHHKAMYRVKKASMSIYKFFEILLWHIPKFLLWDVPKHVVVLPVIKGGKWLKAHHQEVPGIVSRWLKKIPKKIAKGAKETWKIAKEVPSVLKKVLLSIWRKIKSTPKVARMFLMWMWGGLAKFGTAITHILGRLFSFLHTAFSAVFSFFRGLTLKDVVDGFVVLLRAVFVDTPKLLLDWLLKLGEVSYKATRALFGTLGCILWFLGSVVIAIFIYVPKKLAVILAALAQSMAGGWKEVMIWVNPKRA